MKEKTAIVSVINDLATDQRVNRTCLTLVKMGYRVILVGRELPQSLPLAPRPYETLRMKLLFIQGPAFYIEFQIRLFFFLLNNKANLLFSNDLDTLLPNFVISKIQNISLIYDSHELFCEVPELISNPAKRKIWKNMERHILPQIEHIITVNGSIADIYSREYHKRIWVVRNIPQTKNINNTSTRESLHLPTDKKILILQGAGINMDRGAEELVEAMQWIENAVLLIVGSGDVLGRLKIMVQDLAIEERVIITGKVPYEKLAHFTALADLGFSLDKDTNLNYRYSLPNKLFDYIQAAVPVVVSNLVEVAHIVNHYDIGVVLSNHDPKTIAHTVNKALNDESTIGRWKNNLAVARQELIWEREEEKLMECIGSAAKSS